MTNPTETTETGAPAPEEQDVVRMVAQQRAADMMTRFVGNPYGNPKDPSNWGDFEQRIAGIQRDKAKMGRSKSLMSKYVPECVGDANGIYDYCMGSYWTSLQTVMGEKNPKGFMHISDPNYTHIGGSPHISTYAAVNWFETNKDEEFRNCGQSMRDFHFREQDPEKQTVGQMLREGYEDGSIPIGSLVMVRRDKGLLHAVMFAGFNEQGEPLFSCANNEHIRETMSVWANQKLKDKGNRAENHDVYVINTQRALEVRLERQERERYNSMGHDAYLEAHPELAASLRAPAEPVPTLQPIQPEKIDTPPEKPLEVPAREAEPVSQSVKGTFGDRLAATWYGLTQKEQGVPVAANPMTASQKVCSSAVLTALQMSNSNVVAATVASAQATKSASEKQSVSADKSQDALTVAAQKRSEHIC